MNNGILNAELALAVRKCLPFVKRHAIISGGDGSVTYAFAVRALADYDARQNELQAVKNIIHAREAMEQAARAVRPGEGYLPAAPPAKNCTCDTCTQYRRSSLNFYKD